MQNNDSKERDIKNNLAQKNNKKNQSDELSFCNASKIYDLCFKNEWKKMQFFSFIIAIIYAIDLIILGLSLIFSPAAISIYATLFTLVAAPIAIALYCNRKFCGEEDEEIEENGKNKIFSDEVIEEIEKGFFDNPTSYILFNPGNDILLVSEQITKKIDKDLSSEIEKNIKPILKLAIYFFIFAAFGVAINLFFLQTIFIYVSLAILAIIIFSVGYKINAVNKELYKNNFSDDLCTNDEIKEFLYSLTLDNLNKNSDVNELMNDDVNELMSDLDKCHNFDKQIDNLLKVTSKCSVLNLSMEPKVNLYSEQLNIGNMLPRNKSFSYKNYNTNFDTDKI